MIQLSRSELRRLAVVGGVDWMVGFVAALTRLRWAYSLAACHLQLWFWGGLLAPGHKPERFLRGHRELCSLR